jgi:hypothetical protein
LIGAKRGCRVKVILSALIDDLDVAVSSGVLVRHNAVYLVQLKRGGISGVVDADDKARWHVL